MDLLIVGLLVGILSAIFSCSKSILKNQNQILKILQPNQKADAADKDTDDE